MATLEFLGENARLHKSAGLSEHDRVRLVVDLRDDENEIHVAGSTGTVVHVYRNGAAYEVELTRPRPGVVTVKAGALEAIAG